MNNIYNLTIGSINPSYLIKTNELIYSNLSQNNNLNNFNVNISNFLNDITLQSNKIKSTNIIPINSIMCGLYILLNYFKLKGFTKIYVEELTQNKIIKLFKNLYLIIDTFNFNDLDDLDKKIEIDNLNKIKSIIYIIPFCNVPNGISINDNELNKLVNIITKNNIYLISDELYFFLQFKITKFNPLAYYSNNIISLNSFTKILSSDIKVGWIYLKNESLLKDLNTYINTIGLINPLNNNIVSNILQNNNIYYYKLLSKLRENLLNKLNTITQILSKYPNYFTFDMPNGGHYILMKTLKVNSLQLCDIFKKHKILIMSALEYIDVNNIDLYNYYIDYVVLSYSYYDLNFFQTVFDNKINDIIKDINDSIHI